jgi:hypothetical protein
MDGVEVDSISAFAPHGKNADAGLKAPFWCPPRTHDWSCYSRVIKDILPISRFSIDYTGRAGRVRSPMERGPNWGGSTLS